MTKPFPCCQCAACVHCPQYTFVTDIWTYLLASLSIGSAAFVSSTTGNALHTDLNALGATNFAWTSTSTPSVGVKQVSYSTTDLFPATPTKKWRYTPSGSATDYLIHQVYLTLTVRDHCGKVWIHLADLLATELELDAFGVVVNSTPITLARFLSGSEPGSTNCATNLVNTMTVESNYIAANGVGSVTLDPP